MDATVVDGRKIIHMEFGRFADALKFALTFLLFISLTMFTQNETTIVNSTWTAYVSSRHNPRN